MRNREATILAVAAFLSVGRTAAAQPTTLPAGQPTAHPPVAPAPTNAIRVADPAAPVSPSVFETPPTPPSDMLPPSDYPPGYGPPVDEPPPVELLDSPVPPASFLVTAPRNDDGKHLALTWDLDPVKKGLQGSAEGYSVLVFRRHGAGPEELPLPPLPFTLAVGKTLGAGKDQWTLANAIGAETSFTDEVEPGERYSYAVIHATEAEAKDTYAAVSPPVFSQPRAPQAAYFNTDYWFYLLVISLIAVALFGYMRVTKKRPQDVFIRRIPGVDAIEEAVGRSTEMGRPVLYVTGTAEIKDIQTLASLLILGHVAELTAQYDTDLKVANCYPLTMVVAEEIVRQGYANAGRIDAHKPENVMFFSSEQFAFAASINGLVLRDRPATNIFLGRFYGESLILAETGFITGAVQIGGTAEVTQLPFFIAACDYAVIGEELYAVSAYLTREPTLLATLKATDLIKVLIIVTVIVGAVLATGDWFDLGKFLVP